MLENNYPKDWSKATIKNLTQRFLNGGTPRTHINEYWDGDIPWITGADAEQRVTITSRKTITALGVKRSSTNIVPKGNILLVTRTGVGKVSMAGVDVAISQDLTGIIPRVDLIDVPYLYYQLTQIASDLKSFAQGSIIQGIKREQVEAIEIPLPELTEQRVIAEILSTLDESIAKSESLVRKYQSLKQGLMYDLLTRGINDNGELRPSYEEAPNLYRETSLGRSPKEWDGCTLLEIVPVVEYGTSVAMHDEPDGIPVLRMNNLFDGEFDLSELRYSKNLDAYRHKLKSNDVLFNRTNSLEHVGRTSIWKGTEDMSFASYLVRLSPDTKRVLPDYLNFWMNLPQTQLAIRRYATPGVHQVNINPTNLRKTNITLPKKLSEQEKIVGMIHNQKQVLKAEVAALVKLQVLKQGLMQDLLSGQVRVKV